MVAPILYASIGLGPLMLINGFIAAGVGGVGNPKGGLLGGVLVAGSGAITSTYLDPGYQPLVTFVLLLGVLLIRPNGLVGKVAGARV
jgi:branched-subunit amino acid ABC-type transport system permease component